MQSTEFWSIVGKCREDAELLVDFNTNLVLELDALPVEEIASFRLAWLAASDGLYSWDVWDASALMLNGTDDDSFMDFRSWAISLGRPDYDSIRADADNLAEYGRIVADAESAEAEELSGIPERLYLARAGVSPPDPPDQSVLTKPFGKRTDLHDTEAVMARFPRIHAWRSRAVR
ncbi:DUF4240 domain-containing protein [Actinoplanes sp. NPDC051411]|uniref:DUF4240 domain-containing protein n=1 Tax=Actinoplanes sp. NPDC051411 TaxID=3155522 RepID=UPI003424326B